MKFNSGTADDAEYKRQRRFLEWRTAGYKRALSQLGVNGDNVDADSVFMSHMRFDHAFEEFLKGNDPFEELIEHSAPSIGVDRFGTSCTMAKTLALRAFGTLVEAHRIIRTQNVFDYQADVYHFTKCRAMSIVLHSVPTARHLPWEVFAHRTSKSDDLDNCGNLVLGNVDTRRSDWTRRPL